MAKNPKRPSNDNAAKGRKLHNTIESKSKSIRMSRQRVSENSDSVLDSLNALSQTQHDALYNLQKSLSSLDKKSPTYKDEVLEIKENIKETAKRITTYDTLANNLKNSTLSTNKLLESIEESDKNLKFVVSQLELYFKQVALAQQATGSDLGFNREDVLDNLQDILNKKEMEKLEKNLERLDKWVKDPLKKSGIFGNLTNSLAVSFFGPIGKQLSEALDLTNRVETSVVSGLDAILKKSSKADKQQEEIIERLKQSELEEEKKEQILRQIQSREERTREKESFRERLFRKKLLNNQKDLKTSLSERSGFFRKFFSVGAISSALVLGIPAAFKKLGASKLGVAVGGLFRYVSPLISKILGPAAWILTAFQGGWSIGTWIDEKWGDEIGDAIWWIHERIVGIGDWLTDFKEESIDKVLAGVDWAKEKIDTVKSAINDILLIKDKLFNFVGNRVREVKDNVINNVSGFYGSAASAVTNARGNARNFVGNAVSSIGSGISGSLSAISNFVTSGSQDVISAIREASGLVGVPFDFMLAMAKQESGLDPKAKAPTSSARGLYQFISRTWSAMVSKYGAKYGIGIDDIEDPRANAIMGALYVKDNEKVLASKGIPIDYTSLYAAHFLGAGGASKLLSADRGVIAETILPDAAKSNKWVFNNRDGSKRTVGEVIDFLFRKVTSVANSISGSSIPNAGVMSSTTVPSVPSVPMQSNTPQYIMAPTASSVDSTSTSSTSDNRGKLNIDDIPMYADDMSLMQLALGTL